MNNPNEKNALSPYLKQLVDQGLMPEDAAKILNHLPAEELEAAVKRWKDLLDEPAKQVVAEFNQKRKGGEPFIDFMFNYDGIEIKQLFRYFEEDLDDFIELLQSDLEDFLKTAPCPVCKDPLTIKRHIDCSRLDGFRRTVRLRKMLHEMGGKLDAEGEAKGVQYEAYLAKLEKEFASGRLKDGTPWNASKTNTSVRLNKIVDASGHIPGKKNPHHKN